MVILELNRQQLRQALRILHLQLAVENFFVAIEWRDFCQVLQARLTQLLHFQLLLRILGRQIHQVVERDVQGVGLFLCPLQRRYLQRRYLMRRLIIQLLPYLINEIHLRELFLFQFGDVPVGRDRRQDLLILIQLEFVSGRFNRWKPYIRLNRLPLLFLASLHQHTRIPPLHLHLPLLDILDVLLVFVTLAIADVAGNDSRHLSASIDRV